MRRKTQFKGFTQNVNQEWFSFALLLLRIVFGLMLFLSGISKLGDWSAEHFLLGASGPFAEFFVSLAGNPIVDQLNIWGQIIIGAAIVIGIFVRPASFFGVLMMSLYYLAHFEQNTEFGIIDQHIIYIALFILLMSGAAGHIFGIDGLIYDNIRRKSWWRDLLFG